MLWTAPPPARECHEYDCCLLRCVGRYWHIASFRCAAKFGRYWGKADKVDWKLLRKAVDVNQCRVADLMIAIKNIRRDLWPTENPNDYSAKAT
jgi:hypothetical protein